MWPQKTAHNLPSASQFLQTKKSMMENFFANVSLTNVKIKNGQDFLSYVLIVYNGLLTPNSDWRLGLSAEREL